MNDKAQVVKNRVNNSPSPSVVEPEEPKKPKKPVYKNYAHGDAAQVLNNRVNNSPSPSLNPNTGFLGTKYDKQAVADFEASRKGFTGSPRTQPPPGSPLKNFEVGTILSKIGNPQGEERSLFSVIEPSLRGSAVKLPGVQQEFAPPGGKYDETQWRDKKASGSGPGPSMPAGQTPFVADRSMSGIERFDPTKLTLGNTPSGKLGMFKDGKMLDSGSVRLSGGNLGGTPLPAGQSPFFMKSEAAKGLGAPQPQTGIPGVTMSPTAIPGSMPGGDWTGVMNQETAMLNSVLNPGATPGGFQDFSKTIGLNPGEGKDSNYKLIEGQISDLINQNKQLMNHGYGQSGEFAKLSPTQRNSYIASNAQQIASLQNSLTGRSSLANDLVKALIGAQSDANVVGLSGQNSKDTAHITGQYGMMEAGVKARGDVAAAEQTRNDNVNDKQTKNKIAALRGSLAEMRQLQANGDTSPERQKLIDETLAALIAYGYDENDGEDYTIVPGPATK